MSACLNGLRLANPAQLFLDAPSDSGEQVGCLKAAIGESFDNAAITVDWFHVVQLFTKALDEVRRAEARHSKLPKALHWAILKCADGRLTEAQAAALASVNAPTSQFPFPVSLQRAGMGTGKLHAVGGYLGRRRATGRIAIRHILWFGTRGAFFRPGHLIQKLAQRRSRPARFRAAEGLVLTAASTTAPWRGTATADRHYPR